MIYTATAGFNYRRDTARQDMISPFDLQRGTEGVNVLKPHVEEIQVATGALAHLSF